MVMGTVGRKRRRPMSKALSFAASFPSQQQRRRLAGWL